jgi:hypothetical protein
MTMTQETKPTPEQDAAALAAAREATFIAAQLLKEGGRGAVLLGAARLDLALEKLLKAAMQPHVGGDDNLFDSDRPLNTFSAKIALSFRLGLIDKQVKHALQMIRKVRNDFAHSFEDSSLADHAHRSRLSKPHAEARKGRIWVQIAPILEKETQVPAELRDYVCLVVTLVSFMEACAHTLVTLTPCIQVNMGSVSRS